MFSQSLQSLLVSCTTDFKLEHYQLQSYKIKLTQPWNTASHNFHYRQGFILKLITAQGLIACGECALLDTMGTETISEAQLQLTETLDTVKAIPIDESCPDKLAHYPASRFALETAILSLISQYRKQNLAQLLNPDASKSILVNAMLGDINQQNSKNITHIEKQGFQCLKFKLGIQPVEQEARQLKTLLIRLKPETRIRLDCNKSWTLAQSQWFLDFINSELKSYIQRIDSIEEPLREFNIQNYRLLQKQTSISLALDESLNKLTDLKLLPVQRIVLKPTLIGGIIKSWQLAQIAQSRGIEVVITSAIETAYGLWPICYLAAAVNNGLHHGLATAYWLEDTLIEAPEIKHGRITL